MNCDEMGELLDAYAIGALEKKEAEEVERHVAGCLGCWEEFNKSQRTASLLALSVPIHQAPPLLRGRLMVAAEREVRPAERVPFWQRFQPNWRTTVRGVAFAGVAALVFSAFLQVQMDGLRGDKNELREQLTATSSELEQQRQIMSVIAAPDTNKIPVEAASMSSQAESVYNWSRENRTGFIVCSDFPPPPKGSVYQVWFTAEGASAEPVATFVPQDGGCQIPMDYSRLNWRPAGIGISVEPEGGSIRPSRPWFAYASFQRDSEPGSGRSEAGMDMALAAFGP